MSSADSYQMTLAREVREPRPPLAERMRPRTLDEIYSQDDVVGPESSFGRVLRDPDSPIPSVLLWGPPGVGKTTIAQVIANTSDKHFIRLSGVVDGVKELRLAVEEAKQELRTKGRQTLCLVDEIHRFNKAQQDAFLPHVESGLLTVIGQTTENVSFRIRNALLSRMKVLELKPLSQEALLGIIDRALGDKERGLGEYGLSIAPEASDFLIRAAGGDARRVLNGLEWAASDAKMSKEPSISLEVARRSAGAKAPMFDQKDDYHYDFISAFIKSMRGSDPDAALFYMLRALEGGEDPLFITRRMIIFASEDCSCDPRALEVAINVDKAVQVVGLPEGRINLAHGVVYLACCSKSNASYIALRKMEKIVRDNLELLPPKKIRNAPTDFMSEQGNAQGYNYPHNFPGGFVPEEYLPEELQGVRVYEPTDRALDAKIKERLESFRNLIEKEKPK